MAAIGFCLVWHKHDVDLPETKGVSHGSSSSCGTPLSISGTVLDDKIPHRGGRATRCVLHERAHRRRRWPQAAGPMTTTDDCGMYRLSGLSVGDSIVHVPSVQVTTPEVPAAQPRPPVPSGATQREHYVRGSLFRWPPSRRGWVLDLRWILRHSACRWRGLPSTAMAFHPAARFRLRMLPTAVSLGYGDERQNVDVQLRLVPASPRVWLCSWATGCAGEAADRIALPVPSEGLALGAEAALTTTDGEGGAIR